VLCEELLRCVSDIEEEEEMSPCLECTLTAEGGRSRAGVGRGRLAPRGSAPPCRAPLPNDSCTAEGGLLPPRARPRARGRVFAPSPTLLGPFAPQRVAAAHRCDVAKGFEASCCLPLAMAVRACTCTCDCTATVTPTAVGEHEMGSKGSAAKAGGRLEPPSTLAPCCTGSTATVGSRVCDFACSTERRCRAPDLPHSTCPDLQRRATPFPDRKRAGVLERPPSTPSLVLCSCRPPQRSAQQVRKDMLLDQLVFTHRQEAAVKQLHYPLELY